MNKIDQQRLTGERALFQGKDLEIINSIFEDGESPLKESCHISLKRSMFRWKYPLWYSHDITVEDCSWFEMARAGVWYTDRIRVKRALIEAPKNFRRCSDMTLEDVSFADAKETLWNCSKVRMNRVFVRGDYFAMNCSDVEAEELDLVGNYGFDGASDVVIRNSRLLTKDAFWNCKNVTVIDSFISGEYLGWNSENLTFIGCTIESLQGLCYINNLKMKNCRLINTTLAFEYSSVDAQIDGYVDSIFNPSSGRIEVDSVGELTMDPEKIDPSKTEIVIRKKES